MNAFVNMFIGTEEYEITVDPKELLQNLIEAKKTNQEIKQSFSNCGIWFWNNGKCIGGINVQ